MDKDAPKQPTPPDAENGEAVEVECPSCGAVFRAVCTGPCKNAPSARCPVCGTRVGLPPLVVKI